LGLPVIAMSDSDERVFEKRSLIMDQIERAAHSVVIARLGPSVASVLVREASAYWIPRFRVG